jgi:hypothetical protein
VDVEREEQATLFGAPLPPTLTDVRHLNGYAYTTLRLVSDLNVTIGVSIDSTDGSLNDGEQVNPKFGIAWEPIEGTTLRAAAVRTLTRTLVANQTIEPTQVAGFNQFFDDPEGTDAWRFGLGIDQRLSNSGDPPLYVGAEISRRELELVGVNPLLVPSIVEGDGSETLVRAYAYWAPHPHWAFVTSYLYEGFDRDPAIAGPEGFAQLDTHRLSIGGTYFHPSGLEVGLRATLVDQAGDFVDPLGTVAPGDDEFFVVDAVLGYRLPKRYGFIGVVGRNIFDEKFRFQDTDPGNPRIVPEAQLLLRANVFF